MSFFLPNSLFTCQIVPISKAEAEQRRGRAGRTQPGECYRIYECVYGEFFFSFSPSCVTSFFALTRLPRLSCLLCFSRDFVEHMPVHTVPEIQRSSLDDVVLTLKCLGIEDVVHFDYLDPPEQYLLLEALRRLYFFDALDRHGQVGLVFFKFLDLQAHFETVTYIFVATNRQVTVAGQLMAQFPLSPSLSRVLLFSLETSMPKPWVKDLLGVVAMLSGEDPFVRPRTFGKTHSCSPGRCQLITEVLTNIFGCAFVHFATRSRGGTATRRRCSQRGKDHCST